MSRVKLISIDPGLRACAVAAFDAHHKLIFAGLSQPVVSESKALIVHQTVHFTDELLRYRLNDARIGSRAVIELPQTYKGRAAKGDGNDLISVALVVGGLTWLCGRSGIIVDYVHPHDWKGSVPKSVTKQRVLKRLSAEELKRVEWPGRALEHNVYDAIGIGLKELGRQYA